MSDGIDTSNKFLVVAHEDSILFNPAGAAMSRVSKQDALNLAAWLVLTADSDGERFTCVLQTIQAENFRR